MIHWECFDNSGTLFSLFPEDQDILQKPNKMEIMETRLTPGGNPASLINGPKASAAKGVFSDGFKINTFPVANAGAAFSAAVLNGPFQGTIPATTPNGSFLTIFKNPSSRGKD